MARSLLVNRNVEKTSKNTEGQAQLDFNNTQKGLLILGLSGAWLIGSDIPPFSQVEDQVGSAAGTRALGFDTRNLTDWDSGLLTFLINILHFCSRENIRIDSDGLPAGVRKLLALATAVPEKKDTRSMEPRSSFLSQVGSEAVNFLNTAGGMLAFVGEATLALGRLLTGRARYRRSDFILTIQQCGAQALPIVSLISLLVGLILGFIGAVQLAIFGAEIFVADLVGIAMVRVMGAVMAGIIMAGRTGAAFAAQLGTMETNEEIDALKTMGISPMEFLVLPRMLALALMMPLLCLYADLMGILGGFIVGVGMLDITPVQYFHRTKEALTLSYLWVGLFHGFVFGVLVAIAGCMKGMQCGRSASAVGDAATSAVVTGIVSIIVATAIITILCNVIGI